MGHNNRVSEMALHNEGLNKTHNVRIVAVSLQNVDDVVHESRFSEQAVQKVIKEIMICHILFHIVYIIAHLRIIFATIPLSFYTSIP